jgi:methionyl-tRNA formyltransferase
VDRRGARARSPDFVFSFYYRYMLNAGLARAAARGALNMHGSLLPKYRGRAPVHWAIIHGETVTGASLHYMVEKPDAGALVDQQRCPSWRTTRRSKCLDQGGRGGAAGAAAQSAEIDRRHGRCAAAGSCAGSYFGRRRPEDGRIDWRRGRARCTIWCARWRRRFRVPLPR